MSSYVNGEPILAGLDERLFYDPYLTESPTIEKRVFAGRDVRGLTRNSRFRNMGLDAPSL